MIKITVLIIILSSLLLLVNCGRVAETPNSNAPVPENSSSDLDKLDYQIYMAIIRKSQGAFRVGDKTKPDQGYDRVGGLLDGQHEDVLNNFKARNEKPIQLERKFETDREYLLVDSLEFNKPVLGKNTRTKSTLETYGSYYIFSGVGFSRDHKLAIVYADYYCPLCGEGGYYLLSNENGQWEVIKTDIGWMS